jgi:dCTP deaminase
MVLTDREIQVAIQEGQIIVDPLPDPDRFSSSSLDLTLGRTIRIWERFDTPGVEPPVMCPGAADYNYAEVAKNHTQSQVLNADGFVMKPRDFVLGWTTEEVSLPAQSRLAARVEGKSSLARIGIGIHITAPTIHAGFSGSIQLEIFNLGPLHVRLVPGMPVCQLIFEQTLGTPQKGYQGQFLGQQAD